MKRSLNDASRRQVPFAVAKALTLTAKAIEKEIQSAMASAFNPVSQYVKRSTFVSPARKSLLTAMVGLKDARRARGTSPAVLLLQHFTGGLRGNKPFEKKLISLGAMPVGYRAIPARGMKLDANGNPRRGDIARLLQAVQELVKPGAHYTETVSTGSSRGRQKNQADVSYFLKKVGDNSLRARHLVPGLYRRIQPGGAKKGAAIPVLVFVKQAAYRKLIDMERIGRGVVGRDFQREFDAAFRNAVKTAR